MTPRTSGLKSSAARSRPHYSIFLYFLSQKKRAESAAARSRPNYAIFLIFFIYLKIKKKELNQRLHMAVRNMSTRLVALCVEAGAEVEWVDAVGN